MRLLVAGGAGFIGSNFARHRLAAEPGNSVVVLDKLTYAGRRENLDGLPAERFELIEGDIADRDIARSAIDGCDAVLNFAAESHVDRSIESPGEFITTDVYGSFVLLEAARDEGLRYLQVSTDEVYGPIPKGSAGETSPLDPSSPYAASKAAGDLIVSAFARTYGLDAVILRASNNYGPYQHPEKLIPLSILNALAGDPVPVYGDGTQVRNWLFVEDCCAAIGAVLERGKPGEGYNAGGRDERRNIDVVRRILELTGRDESLIEHVPDRPGHDMRYSLDSQKLSSELGWEVTVRFDEGLERTVQWYRENERWWAPIRSGEYRDYYERQYGRALS
jgi:dTDP-glucose 4,6-dehydratase